MHLETTAGLFVDRTLNVPDHIRDVRTYDHPSRGYNTPKHLKKPLSEIIHLTEDSTIATIESEPIEIVDIEPTENPVAGIPLAVDAGDKRVTTALPFFVYKKNIKVEVPYPAPGLVVNLEGEGT
jgi:hypothetical protein